MVEPYEYSKKTIDAKKAKDSKEQKAFAISHRIEEKECGQDQQDFQDRIKNHPVHPVKLFLAELFAILCFFPLPSLR